MGFRAMRRFKQQLPMEECEVVLEKAYRGFLSVNGDDGYPYTMPVNFLYHDRHIYFHSAVKGYKMDAVKRSSKACFTVINDPVKEENDWWFHVESVICFGQITVVEDNCERIEKLRLFGKKYFPHDYDIEKELEQNVSHVALLDFSIEYLTGKKVKEN